MVACVAGVGAWGASVTVSPNPEYATELFGAGHAAISYPEGMTPMVMLTIPGDVSNDGDATTGGDNPLTASVETDFNSTGGETHMGEAEITINILGGTFDANVTGLMWDVDLAADGNDADEGDDGDGADDSDPATGNTMNDYVAAPGTAVSIVSGGRKGDSSITIKVMAAGAADNTVGERDPGNYQRIRFALPKLVNAALAGANITDAKTDNDVKTVWARAESRIVSGAFTDGFITGAIPHYVTPVIRARDSVTLKIEASDDGMKTIALKDDAAKGLTAFKSVKEKNKDGYVELATVTVTTQQPNPATAVEGSKRMVVGKLRPAGASVDAAADQELYKPAVKAVPAAPYMLHDLDGEAIDEGLRGTLTVNAMGTRDLFNEDDMLFIDYDKNGKMGSGEAIEIDGDMGMGDALSVDSSKSESFDKGGTGAFKVFYMPGGKGNLNHGAMINLTAMVDYSDPTAIDEAPKKSSTTMNFDGVTSEVDAYAIPQSGNGKGDMANVRVRCEASMGCRVFLECWDDDGMRSFGEAGIVAGNALAKWDSAAIEEVLGIDEATSRHSCRILSAGMVKVQQLTRDGSSGTLVNNTYVGD